MANIKRLLVNEETKDHKAMKGLKIILFFFFFFLGGGGVTKELLYLLLLIDQNKTKQNFSRFRFQIKIQSDCGLTDICGEHVVSCYRIPKN